MNSLVLIKKELREIKWPVIIGLILLAAFAFINAYTYEFMQKLLGGSQSTNVPDFMKESLKQMSDYTSYIWYSWFGKSYYQILSIISIIIGMGLVAGEVSKDTISFLLTKPYSRTKVYTIKYLVSAVCLFLIGFLASIVQYVAVVISGREYAIGKLFLGVISSFPGLLVIFTLAALLSNVFNDRVKAGLIAAVVTILLSVPGLFPDYEKYSILKYITSAAIINGEGFAWAPFFILLIVAIMLFVAGLQLFRKKQF